MEGQWVGFVTIIASVVGSTAYLRGRIESLRDETLRQNGVDGTLFSKVDKMVPKVDCKDHRDALRRELKSSS